MCLLLIYSFKQFQPLLLEIITPPTVVWLRRDRITTFQMLTTVGSSLFRYCPFGEFNNKFYHHHCQANTCSPIKILLPNILQQRSVMSQESLLGSYVKENKAKNNTAFGLLSVGSFKEKIIPMESLVKMLNTDRVNSSEMMSLPPEKNSSWFPTLSRTQRLLGFAFCFISGLICLGLASLYLPLLLLKARKFGTLYTFALPYCSALGPSAATCSLKSDFL
ncbi:hypothetical protein T02_706 [Trichinella nativa]|uniref:Vesicle transport protein n=1 Tax=Trichinella nativa TaxID=6335 RepID=A0A0V1L0D9_9BILA|nr:hypothetical protein T02_706 [Trichinella nativa]